MIPCVSLHRHLEQPLPNADSCNLILAEFNRSQTAFVVDHVERIYRVGWEKMLPAPPIVAGESSPITGLTNLGDGLVMMLDFEKISAEISQEDQPDQAIANPNGVNRESVHVVIVDDSPTIRKSLAITLKKSGYNNVTAFDHGLHAWEWIEQRIKETGDWREVADLVVSDVEMPAMDGLHLTKCIKEHPQLHQMPVVLYSSIATPDNQKKGASVGADAQITKPELGRVVELADKFVGRSSEPSPEPSPASSQPAPNQPATIPPVVTPDAAAAAVVTAAV